VAEDRAHGALDGGAIVVAQRALELLEEREPLGPRRLGVVVACALEQARAVRAGEPGEEIRAGRLAAGARAIEARQELLALVDEQDVLRRDERIGVGAVDGGARLGELVAQALLELLVGVLLERAAAAGDLPEGGVAFVDEDAVQVEEPPGQRDGGQAEDGEQRDFSQQVQSAT
jgi:hypothetical protein